MTKSYKSVIVTEKNDKQSVRFTNDQLAKRISRLERDDHIILFDDSVEQFNSTLDALAFFAEEDHIDDVVLDAFRLAYAKALFKARKEDRLQTLKVGA
jgi:hypothetical protein